MINLAVLSNPGRKKRKVKRTKKRVAQKAAKRKKRTMKKVVKQIKKRHKRQIKGVKKMAKKHKKSHGRRKAHRSNPVSKAISMVKRSNITGVAIDTVMVAGGYVGQGIMESTILPMIPGYSSLTGIAKTGARVVTAIGVPMFLAFALPMVGIKKSDAVKVSKYVGLGMLSNVVVTEVKAAGILPLGAITPSLPAARSYGLAAATKTASITPKMPTYLY